MRRSDTLNLDSSGPIRFVGNLFQHFGHVEVGYRLVSKQIGERWHERGVVGLGYPLQGFFGIIVEPLPP